MKSEMEKEKKKIILLRKHWIGVKIAYLEEHQNETNGHRHKEKVERFDRNVLELSQREDQIDSAIMSNNYSQNVTKDP